jgi:mannosyltransferase OCH1-like enzyme
MKFWTDENIDELRDNDFEPDLKELVESVFRFEFEDILGKKDILSMVALKKYGGIYLDIDVICLQSF